jgi:putative endonuclease
MYGIILQIKRKKTRMARHNDLGDWGEELAAGWLSEKGFAILHRNWRYRRGEVDIIARLGRVYHFIEVKCSLADAYGYPEQRVGKAKLRSMMRVAAHWLYENHIHAGSRVQYDVLAIQLKDGMQEYVLFEDVSV